VLTLPIVFDAHAGENFVEKRIAVVEPGCGLFAFVVIDGRDEEESFF
jgi:hypothetical protein